MNNLSPGMPHASCHGPSRGLNLSFLLAILLAFRLPAGAQCSDVTVTVSSSDTTLVQLYHPGFFLIPSGFANVCTWDVRAMDGTLLHADTTSGPDFFVQGNTQFTHAVPLSDAMRVELVIDNATENLRCTIVDTLVWLETEVLPGSFIGGWEVLASRGGTASPLPTAITAPGVPDAPRLYPVPAQETLTVEGLPPGGGMRLYDARGRTMAWRPNGTGTVTVDVAGWVPGTYYLQATDADGRALGVRAFTKR